MDEISARNAHPRHCVLIMVQHMQPVTFAKWHSLIKAIVLRL